MNRGNRTPVQLFLGELIAGPHHRFRDDALSLFTSRIRAGGGSDANAATLSTVATRRQRILRSRIPGTGPHTLAEISR